MTHDGTRSMVCGLMNLYCQVAKAIGFRMERAKARGPSHSCLLTHTESQERGLEAWLAHFHFQMNIPLKLFNIEGKISSPDSLEI